MVFGKSIYISSSFVKEVLKTLRLIQLELEKQSEQGDVSNYQANGEFDLVNFSARRNVEYYSCCPEPYPDITYEIRLRRRPMFYVFNLILPCILINSVGEYIYIYILFSHIYCFVSRVEERIMRICNIAKLRDDTRLLYKGGTGSSVLIGSGGGNFIKALESYEGNDESLSHHLLLLLL